MDRRLDVLSFLVTKSKLSFIIVSNKVVDSCNVADDDYDQQENEDALHAYRDAIISKNMAEPCII